MDLFDFKKNVFNGTLGIKLSEVKNKVRGEGIFSHWDPAGNYTAVTAKFLPAENWIDCTWSLPTHQH